MQEQRSAPVFLPGVPGKFRGTDNVEDTAALVGFRVQAQMIARRLVAPGHLHGVVQGHGAVGQGFGGKHNALDLALHDLQVLAVFAQFAVDRRENVVPAAPKRRGRGVYVPGPGGYGCKPLLSEKQRGNQARCEYCSSEVRSEEHTYELQSLMRISYAVFFLYKTIQQ